jgi:hypothetical protein
MQRILKRFFEELSGTVRYNYTRSGPWLIEGFIENRTDHSIRNRIIYLRTNLKSRRQRKCHLVLVASDVSRIRRQNLNEIQCAM